MCWMTTQTSWQGNFVIGHPHIRHAARALHAHAPQTSGIKHSLDSGTAIQSANSGTLTPPQGAGGTHRTWIPTPGGRAEHRGRLSSDCNRSGTHDSPRRTRWCLMFECTKFVAQTEKEHEFRLTGPPGVLVLAAPTKESKEVFVVSQQQHKLSAFCVGFEEALWSNCIFSVGALQHSCKPPRNDTTGPLPFYQSFAKVMSTPVKTNSPGWKLEDVCSHI